MDISAQSIQTVGSQSGPLQSLVAGLKPGDSLTAQILARTEGGLALVALAGKQVQLPLPQSLSPGTVLTLTVQQGANGLQFAIEPQPGSGQAAARAALPQGTAGTSSGIPAPAGTAAAAGGTGPLPSALQPPLVNTRTGLPVPAPLGAAAGQTLTAQVLSTPTASTAIVALGTQELPVSLPASTQPGTLLPLIVQAGPEGLQLAHAPASTAPQAAAGQPGSAPGASAQSLAAAGSPGAPAAGPTSTASLPPATGLLAQATLASLGNQNSISALVSTVMRLGDRVRQMPEDLQRGLQRLSQAALPLEGKAPDAAALQRAIARSGVFLESRLAAGTGDAALENDLKSLLLTVRRALGDWLGAGSRPAAVPTAKPPPPPQPGIVPRAPSLAAGAPLADDAPLEDIGKLLLSQTDAALSRLRLHQIASLPDRPEALLAPRHAVHLEVPVVIGQQPGVLSLVITRDDEGDTPERERQGWRVQFAVNASVIGEVGAEVGLLAGRTNVVLSAAEAATAEALTEGLVDLSGALEAAGLTPGALRVRRMGAAQPVPAFGPESMPRHYLDRDT